VTFAAVETAEKFGPRSRRWAGRLGVKEAAPVTVLGDGADWIGRQAAQQLPGAAGLLDSSHGLEHVSACAKAVYGEGTAQAKAWTEQGRRALLTEGAAGVQAHLAAGATARSAAQREARDGLAGYFGRPAEHLGYTGRLAAGQRIGSGLVEGCCKQVLGRRRKQTGARWRIRRANRMAALCCTLHRDTWNPYWQHRLN
jgi:hypothetical protein